MNLDSCQSGLVFLSLSLSLSLLPSYEDTGKEGNVQVIKKALTGT
jgi:hypothetical protein